MLELDAWIAEHVHGFKKVRRDIDREITGYGFDANNKFTRLPSPTTSPADAMRVLEKCANECGTVKLVKIGNWWVNDGEEFEGKSGSLPLAICLFAKKLFTATRNEANRSTDTQSNLQTQKRRH